MVTKKDADGLFFGCCSYVEYKGLDFVDKKYGFKLLPVKYQLL